jgi:hypothetical protein
MSNLQWDRTAINEYRRVLPDTPPVVDASLWRGVAVGLLLVTPFWFVVGRLIGLWLR